MATRIHKMLVDLIVRKMREKGYTVIAIEGNLLALPESDKVPLPWTIKRHRPDVIGINTCSKKVCIGEAKTAEDLFTKRTHAQLTDFANIIGKSGEKTELIIGVPMHSRITLLKLLSSLNISSKDVSIIVLPEELAQNATEDKF